MSGSEITDYIHDTEPDPANKPTVQPWEPEPAPSAAELLARARINTLFQPLRFFEVVSRSMPGLARASQGLMRRALRTTGASKALTNAVGARNLADYSRFIPSQLAGLAARLSTSAEMRALTERAVPAINTVVTNVPGPQTPLYFAGAEALNFVGLGPVYDGMALIHPVFSYCGRLAISFTSCRETLPDPERYADMLQASFEALQAAAGRAGPAGDSASAAGTRPAVA